MNAEAAPLVFISHKHVDRGIAKVLADFINEESRGEVDVHNSSDPRYLGPASGERLTDALRKALWMTDVLLLIYTAADQDWSFCMWEAGVATDSASPNTRTVILQCGDDVPSVYQGFVRVNLKKVDEVRKFVAEFFLNPAYFPRRQRALTPRWNRESVLRAGEKLHGALADVIRPAQASLVYLWPSLQFELPSTAFKRGDQPECREAVSQSTSVMAAFQGAHELFGVQNVVGMTLAALRDRWRAATGAHEAAWHESCCDQIITMMNDEPAVVRQEELLKPGSETTLLPALTRWRKGDTCQFEFEFIDVSDPRGIPVRDRMLPLEATYFKMLDECERITLVALTEQMDVARRNRLPVLDASHRLKYVIHKSVIDRYLVAKRQNMNALTLADLVNDHNLQELIQAAVFVPASSMLEQARQAMINAPHCEDVFVTESGRDSDPILGWLTNADLRRMFTPSPRVMHA